MLALNSKLTVGRCPHGHHPGFIDAVADILTNTLSLLSSIVTSSVFYLLLSLYLFLESSVGVTLWVLMPDDCPEAFKYLVVAMTTRFCIVMAHYGAARWERRLMRVFAALIFCIVCMVVFVFMFSLQKQLDGRPYQGWFVLFFIVTVALNLFMPLFVVVMLCLITVVTMPCFVRSYKRRQRAAALSREILLRQPTSLPLAKMEPGAAFRYGTCRACMSDFKSSDLLKTFPCGHKFHSACAYERLSRMATCPVCGYVVPCPLC